MCDVTSLSTADLDAHLREAIARRLDPETAEERARAGADLIRIVLEFRRRDGDVAAVPSSLRG
jgi:hypothetical protein